MVNLCNTCRSARENTAKCSKNLETTLQKSVTMIFVIALHVTLSWLVPCRNESLFTVVWRYRTFDVITVPYHWNSVNVNIFKICWPLLFGVFFHPGKLVLRIPGWMFLGSKVLGTWVYRTLSPLWANVSGYGHEVNWYLVRKEETKRGYRCDSSGMTCFGGGIRWLLVSFYCRFTNFCNIFIFVIFVMDLSLPNWNPYWNFWGWGPLCMPRQHTHHIPLALVYTCTFFNFHSRVAFARKDARLNYCTLSHPKYKKTQRAPNTDAKCTQLLERACKHRF